MMESLLPLPELLEAVLLQLDMTTLLVSASRVSKTWHSIITTSPAIQQALYFRPIQANESKYRHDEENKIKPICNPLLVMKFGRCFFDCMPEEYGFFRRASAFYHMHWRTTEGFLQPTAIPLRSPVNMDDKTVKEEEIARRRFTRRGASWRRMLVSQPPPPHLGYLLFDTDLQNENPQKILTALVTPDGDIPFVGLRMGELYDIVQYHAGHHEPQSLWFRVIWDQPREPFSLRFLEEACRKLLAQTNVVVEFSPDDDTAWANHPRDPADLEAFEAAFRCEEYRELEFTASEISPKTPQLPSHAFGDLMEHWIHEEIIDIPYV